MRLPDLPDTLTVVLGTRGSMQILTRVCLKCHADDPKNFEDIAREELPPITFPGSGEGVTETAAERRVNITTRCNACGNTFILQIRSFIAPDNEGAVLHHVHELASDGVTSIGQLGNFVTSRQDLEDEGERPGE